MLLFSGLVEDGGLSFTSGFHILQAKEGGGKDESDRFIGPQVLDDCREESIYM